MYCGVVWKEEEVSGWRVQEYKYLSAKPADKTVQRPTRTRISGKWRKSRISPNKEQCTKPELPKDPVKCGKTKRSENKIENSTILN